MQNVERSVLVDVDLATAYAVITDVERYPEFIPACDSAEVLQRDGAASRVRIRVAAMGFKESFTTMNVHTDDAVTMELEDGPLEHLRGEWRFKALGDHGCRVSLTLDYRPKGVLAHVLSGLVPTVADKLVDTFVRRMRHQAA